MSLTEAQQDIVDNAQGNFLVRACPGSGKTYTIAAKMLKDDDNWSLARSGIAMLSFTNTAQEELANEIEILADRKIAYPHYVGTIDAFINKYIFFPYINLLGYDTSTIKTVGEPYTRNYGYSRKQSCALKFKYDLDGTYIPPSGGAGNVYDKKTIEDAKKVKYAMLRDGQFTQADINYHALDILKKYSHIVATISERFPYFYVDEAQDTTPVHWEILRLITSHKSNQRFGVIGDPDQSIYGWNGAKPEIFIKYQQALIASSPTSVFVLNDCRRSSQSICDFCFKFSTLDSAAIAIDPEVKDLSIEPQIVYYDSLDQIGSIVGDFHAQYGHEEVLIVSRSLKIVDSATRLDSPNPEAIGMNPFSVKKSQKAYMASRALDLLHIKTDYDQQRYADALYRAETYYFSKERIYDRAAFLDEMGFTSREWYQVIEADIQALPDTNTTVSEWAASAQTAADNTTIFRGIELSVKTKGKINYAATDCANFFKDVGAQNVEREVKTVHSAKGKTTDHILVILDDSQAERLAHVLNGDKVEDSEERRIFYVAISRARKTMTLCVPANYESSIKGKL